MHAAHLDTVSNTVNFPAVIKLYADDELIFISDQSSLENDPHLTKMYFQPQDILIDRLGQVFSIHKAEQLLLLKTDRIKSLNEVIKLIQAHLSHHGTVCISKFSASTIHEALNCLE